MYGSTLFKKKGVPNYISNSKTFLYEIILHPSIGIFFLGHTG